MANDRNKSSQKNGFLKFLGRVPGVMKVATMFYCAIDPETPWTVRASGLFALFYLAFPLDLIPDVLILALGIGALDDVAVLYMAYKMTEPHLRPVHRAKALGFFQLNEVSG